MEKSRDAFRTISEVAGWLDVPTHVLRFWESRFSQIKPVKRAGGRRYYRPSDMSLIGGIKTLLHDQGMTIRGVQKMLREQGIKHVSSFSPPLHADDAADVDDNVIEGTAVAVEARKRPVSIPAPVARTTRTAEPEPSVLEPVEETDLDQPDMFPEAEETQEPEIPVFAHRNSEDQVAAEPPAPPVRSIPDTPDVPEIDPLDEDDDARVLTGIAARLSQMSPADLKAHASTLQPIADRLRDLRARMEE